MRALAAMEPPRRAHSRRALGDAARINEPSRSFDREIEEKVATYA
jgi:hypothetical protein